MKVSTSSIQVGKAQSLKGSRISKQAAGSSHSSPIMPSDAGKSSTKTRQAAFSQVCSDEGDIVYVKFALLHAPPGRRTEIKGYKGQPETRASREGGMVG